MNRSRTLFAGNDAKGDGAAKHPASCPKCFGEGIGAFGRPCDWRPDTHQLAARFTLGVPTFNVKVGVLKAQTDASQSASP